MAILINFAGRSRARMTLGERRFADRLRHFLEDDYYCWYDVGVGQQDLHPDFIILHPNRGLFILEVKDWKLDNIDRITKEEVFLKFQGKSVTNPLQQARRYAFAIENLLSQDAALVHQSGKYQGRLIFPYGYGVVLTNIYRSKFESSGLGECIEPSLVICQDEMLEKTDPLEFQERLWHLPKYTFGELLTPAQIDRIRGRLFPEITLSLPTDDPATESSEQTYRFGSDLIRIMDIQQERLARSLGQGHQVIHRVAGSGKTMVLAFRCSHLAQELSKPILVLCYNAVLATKLRDSLGKKNPHVIVQTFHSWCSDRLWRYQIPKPEKKAGDPDAYYQQVVQLVIDGCNDGSIPTGVYGAVLIDEGQDFDPNWLRLVAQQVNPENDHFLLLYDDAQRLRGQRGEKLSLKQLGIQASGRTHILKLNYRNTAEILHLAYAFAQACNEFTAESIETEEVPLIPPESCGRQGIMPELHQFSQKGEETRYIATRVKELVEKHGVAWKDIAILVRTNAIGQAIANRMRQEYPGIPIDWINAHKHNFDPQAESLKLITFDSCKGLEFQIVFICGLGELPTQPEEAAREARLVYVAMTRATDHLIMTCSQRSQFVSRIEQSFSNPSGSLIPLIPSSS